jgi:hypothetical protein
VIFFFIVFIVYFFHLLHLIYWRYLKFSEAIANVIVFLISFSDCSLCIETLLVFAYWFCILLLCWMCWWDLSGFWYSF